MNLSNDQMIALHSGENPVDYQRSVVPPVFMNSLHVFSTIADELNVDLDKDWMYGRVANPTVKIVETKIAQMERGCRGLLFSSGMAAMTTSVMTCCKTGDHIICLDNCYGPAVEFLRDVCMPRYAMEVSFVPADADAIIAAIRPNTRMMVLESPTSLVFEVIELEAVVKAAKANGIITYIDNTYCTPMYQKPLTMGIDIVMHTLSKYLGGHSDLIGGVLACSDEVLGKALWHGRELFGGILGPQEGWLVLRGLRTLSVRLERHQEIAMKVAAFLEAHPKVSRVHYPGLPSHPQYEIAKRQQAGNCGLMSFEITGTKADAEALCNHLKVFQIGVSWGGFESLAVMPMYKRTPEEAAALGTVPQLIRIHCGLEGADVLIEDLRQALAVCPDR